MVKAIWNGTVLAESDRTVMVEGNHYFPPEAIHRQYFQPSRTTSVCHWKGTASYYDVVVGDGDALAGAVWYYPDPYDAVEAIRDHVAFYADRVTVTSES